MNEQMSLFGETKKSKKINVQDINKELFEHFIHLKKLTNREYILYRKYYELMDFQKRISLDKIAYVKNKIMTFEDVKNLINSLENDISVDINIKLCSTKQEMLEWTILRKCTSVLHWSQNPGRNIKFLIYVNDKIAGMLSFGSDVISIGVRDSWIGWTKDIKLKNEKRLNNVAIATTLVPTQPLGYLTNGGKLLSLLVYHSIVRNEWERKYKDKLSGITTTSLFGINSQYLGMPKYWKTLGETKGYVKLSPMESIYKKIRDYLRDEYTKEYAEIMGPGGKQAITTGAKEKVLSLYYKESGFRDLWKEKSGMSSKDLQSHFVRGVYFARFYHNTLEFLRGEISDDKLENKKHLDFDISDGEGILKYWYRKYAKNRFKKMDEKKLKKHSNILFLNVTYDMKNPQDFVKKYI